MLSPISSETIARITQEIEHNENIEFHQKQYNSPIHSRSWYQTQVVRQISEWLGYSLVGGGYLIIPLILLMIIISLMVYIIAPLHRFLLRQPPKNPLVRFNFSQRNIMIFHENKLVETIEFGLVSSLMCEQKPLFLSRANKLIILQVYDKNSQAHTVLEMETAPLFGQTDARFLKQTDDLLENLAKRMNLKLFFDKSNW